MRSSGRSDPGAARTTPSTSILHTMMQLRLPGGGICSAGARLVQPCLPVCFCTPQGTVPIPVCYTQQMRCSALPIAVGEAQGYGRRHDPWFWSLPYLEIDLKI